MKLSLAQMGTCSMARVSSHLFSFGFFLILFSLFPSFCFSQGETCATALQVTPGTYITDGTSSGGGAVNSCLFPISGDATDADWYLYTATSSGAISVGSCGGGIDTRLSVFSGSCGALICYSANDDECEIAPEGNSYASQIIDLAVVEGESYYIQWDNRWSASGFEWSFSFTTGADIPLNDEPCDAITLTCPQTVSGSNDGATQSAIGPPSCTDGTQNDVFYKIDAIAGKVYTVTVNGVNYGGVLAAYTGSCTGPFTELSCSDDGTSAGISETIHFSVASDQTVYIQTYDWAISAGEFVLSVSCHDATDVPDEPCEARILNCGESFSGSSSDATPSSIGFPSCAIGSQNDVFFKFTALANVPYSVTVNGDLYDGVLAAYSGSCSGVLTELDCSDSGLINGEAETVNILVPTEQEILIQTYDYPSINPNSDYTITLNCGIPNNNNCADAITLSVNDPGTCSANQVIGTTAEATASNPDACESSSPDVYYTFNSGSTYSTIRITVDAVTATDLVTSIFEEDCASTAIYCDFDLNLSYDFPVNPETTYILRVHSFYANSEGTFLICTEGVYECPDLSLNVGDSCNDGYPNTINDIVTTDCTCEGISVPYGYLSGTITGWSSACGERDLVANLVNSNTGNSYSNLPGTLHSNGNFTLDGAPGIIPGTYSVLVKVDGSLSKRVDGVMINSGPNTVVVQPITLGDLNNDNVINISDISQFTAAFGSAIGDPNYNPWADFNCDGAINITDVSKISNNFGESGDIFIL